MKLPLTFPTYSQLRADGWKMKRIQERDLDLDIAAERDGRRVLGYTWTLMRDGFTVSSGTATTRAHCVHDAYKSIFVEKQA